ncbi:MAG: UDP-N-acetyl glucosamine 2-epimerase [Planctomycetota bacterium]
MRALLVAGARPQFVKAAALLPALRRRGEVRFVHTGQHPDAPMVESHFGDLGLPAPDRRLEAAAAGRGARMEVMVDRLAAVVGQERPQRIVALGDADSAMAAAAAGRRCSVAVAHVEAGARCGDRSMPEERNRIAIDGISDLCFCSTAGHAANLAGRDGVHVVGDVMADVLLPRRREIRERAPAGDYAVLTLHRAATADDAAALGRVLGAVARAGLRTLFPVHPRTARTLPGVPAPVERLPPLPYLEFLGRVAGARVVVTDSGGVQKEAYLLGTPCVTLRERTEWPETVDAGWNALVGTDPDRIVAALREPPQGAGHPALYGDGDAAERIAALLQI